MKGVRFIGDIAPEHISDEFLESVDQTLSKIPLTFVEPENPSIHMTQNLARTESTGVKWYLIQPFTRDSLMYLCQLDVLLIRLN